MELDPCFQFEGPDSRSLLLEDLGLLWCEGGVKIFRRVKGGCVSEAILGM